MALRAPRVPYPETPGPGTPIQPTYSAPDTLPGGLDALPDRPASEHSTDEPTQQQAPSQPPTIDSGGLDSLPDAHPMQDALVSAYGADPDQAARVLSLARLSGDSPDQVQANLEKYVKASSTPTPDQMRNVPAVAPGVSRFLSNPSGMAIAKDDVPNLLTQEQLIRDHGTFLNFMDTMGTIASPAASTMSASYGLASQAARIPAGLFTLASTVSNQNARIAAAMTGTQPPSQYPTPKILSKNPVTDWLDEQANSIRPRIMNEEFAPLIQSGQYGSAALKLVNVLATFPPFITALASTGGFGAAALAVGQAGEATKQAQDAGVSAEAGGLNAVGQAATFGLMGEIGPLQILRNFRATVAQQAGEQVANSVMKKVGGLMVRGFVPGAESQMVMTAGNAMSEWASGVNPHALEGLASKMAESGLAGGIAGAFGAIPEAVELQHQAERARQSKEFITSLGDTVEAGKLKARMPEAQRALIDEITADGPVKSVFMPVSRFIDLFQSAGKDPEEVAADAGLGDSFEEAKRTGGSVEIPLATWADKFTGTTYGELGNDIKLSADELTINEVKDREAEVKAMVDKQTASQPDAELQARLDESAARVQDVLAKKFEGAVIQGRKLSKSDAVANAKMFAAGIKSAAAREGTDPFALFSRTFGSLMLGETPEKPLTEEDMAAIEAEAQQQYMDQALVENGGLTPVMDSLRGFGGLDYADLKANGYRGEFTDLGYSGVFKPGGRKLHDAANHLVEQGLIPENDYRHIFDALRSESQAITDFKHNRSASEYNNIRRRLEQGPNKDLIIQHNLSAEDLIHADRVGGLAVPSMAITKSGEPATGFGEITLIGDSKLADPQGYARTKVYGADVYAPRYPPVHYKFKFARLKELSDQLRTIAKEAGVSGIATDEIREPEDLRRSGAVMAAFLKEKGIKFKKSTGEGSQFSKEVDTRRNMEQVIRKNKLDSEFQSFADRMFRGLDPEERLFNGYNYNGDRKYKAHTLENVVSILKKNVRAGEGFNYGVGTLRATVTPQFRSLTEIRKESSRIVGSEEFKAIKEEVDGEFFKLADELKPFYKNEAGFGYADTAIQMMGDVAKFGMDKALEENQFANVSDEVKQKMADYLNKLRELPTEYFEAKIPRAVGLQEFKAAVVPEDLAPETRKLLEAKGLKIETYPKGGNSEQARKEAIARAASKHGLLFQSAAEPVPAAPMYSALERRIGEKMPESAPVEQVRGLVKDMKAEEIKWSGIDDFLAGKEKVSKADLLDFLRANQVQVKDVTLGGKEQAGKWEPTKNGFRRKIGNRWTTVTKLSDGTIQGVGPSRYAIKFDSMDEAKAHYDGNSFNTSNKPTKFESYKLPGGENYREVLFTMPIEKPAVESVSPYGNNGFWLAKYSNGKEVVMSKPNSESEAKIEAERIGASGGGSNSFDAGHFNEPNTLAHVRLDDRTDADGKKVLFVEEVQSDWHQKGRKEGYKGELPTGWKAEEFQPPLGGKKWQVLDDKGMQMGWGETREAAVRDSEATGHAVPDAPFRKTWHEFAMKRVLRMAAEGGYDSVAWTTGEQQAERYDLSRQVDHVTFDPRSSILEAFDLNGRTIFSDPVKPENIGNYIGKEAADKLLKTEYKESNPYSVHTLLNADLKVGGEGMKGFYDKIIPDFLRKFGKKFGTDVVNSKVGLQSEKSISSRNALRNFGPESEQYKRALEAESQPGGVPSELASVHSMPITPALRHAALNEGFPLYQSQDGQEPRGGLSTGMGGQMDIHLFRTADLSTFLHESGHFFLNVLTEQALGKGATPETKVLYEDVMKWLGADPWDVEGAGGFTRDQHEKFARGFEAYLREGKAPTTGLRRAFAKFSDWLVKIYRSVAGLNVEVSPAVRDIMDRLLTTDNELTKARAEAGQDQQLPALPPEVQAKIGDIQARAKESAYESLIKERMGELRAENQKVDKERRAEALTKAEAAVDQQPLFVARKAITEKIGKGMFKAVDRILAGHPNESDTAMFSTYAEAGGFKDAHDLAQALKGSDREAEVKKLVDQQMSQYDKSTNGDLRLAAAKAVHTDNSGEAMALERDILAELIQKANQASAAKKEKSAAAAQQKAKVEDASAPARARAAESASTLDLAGKTWDKAVQEWNAQASRASRIKAKVDYEAANIFSRDALRGKQYAEAGRWRTYVTAERNAASKAAVALYKEDFAGYMKAKNEQITNHALASEAMRVAADTRGILKYFDKLTADTRQARIGKAGDDYLEQIQALLSRYGISDTPSSTTDGKRPLAEFVKDAERSGQTLGIPQYMLDESVQKPSRMMTYGELSDLRGATRAIETLARQANEIIGQEKGRTMDDLRQELHSSVTAELAAKGRTAAVDQGAAHDPNPGTTETVEAARRRGVAWLSRPLFLIGEIDGHKANGPAFRNLWSRKVESENTENRMLRTFREFDKSDVFGRYSREERGLFFTRKYDIPEIGPGVRKTKEEMLMIAANWLSDGNRQKLVEDNGFNEDQIKAVFKHLDQRDIDVLESMQKHLESYRDPVSEQVRKLRGEQIEWVDPAPYEATLSDGKVRSMKGGYFPIIMDRERSQRAALPEDIQNVSEMFGGDWSQWTTKNGHTQERVGSKGRPLDLRLSGFYNHVYNVVHDLAYRENLIALHKMVNDKGATDDAGNRVGPSVKDDIISAVGREKWEELNAWIGRMAGDSKKDPTEGWARWLRNKTTTAILAWRLTPGIKHMAAAFTTVHELGPKYAAAGYGKIIHLRENLALAESLFPEFKDRNDAGDRDLHDFVKGRGLLERQGNIAKLAEEAIGGSASAKVAWLSSFKKDAELSFFQFVRWVDKLGSMGALLGSYKKALDGEIEGIAAGDDAAARAHAVRIMQEIKGAGGAGDLARIQGGSDTQRLFTMLYSMKSIKFNQYAKSIQQGTGYKGWTGIAGGGLVSAFAMKWVAEAMWDELIHGMPEDDKKKKKFGWDIATFPGDSVPFVNDAMHYAVNKLAAHLPYDYKASPALDFVPEAVAAASGLTKQLTGGDVSLSEKRAEAHMAGVLFGLPGPMIFQVLDRIEQWETGDNKPENSAQGVYQTLVSGTPRQ